MIRTAVIKDNIVVNVVEFEENIPVCAPEGLEWVASDTAQVGDGWANGAFINNQQAPPPVQLTIGQQLQALEAQQTGRRMREAVLGTDNGWLKNLNDQIAALRAQLTKDA